MLLTKLTLKDVGVYKDSNHFNFTSTPDKPIVLYGGINGAGKTTLFESIPLCLYGQNFANEIITKKQYHEKIYKLFHRCTNTHTSAKDALVILEFQYAYNGVITQYKITRTWQNNDGKIDEFLTIDKKLSKDKEYTPMNIDESQRQLLINQMIPKNIASMFFFDGEKIQNIAQSGTENIHIKSSFDSLLGLNVPSQLYDDIGLYILRNSDGEAQAVLAELEHKTKEKQDAEKKLCEIKEKRVFLTAEIDRRHKELNLKEEEFFKLGGNFAQKRQELINQTSELENDLYPVEHALRNMIEKDLALALVSDQLKDVQEELRKDIASIGAGFDKDTLSAALDNVLKTFEPSLEVYEKNIQNDILKKLETVIDKNLESLLDAKKLTFNFSLSDMNMMLGKIDLILNEKYTSVKNNRIPHKDYLDKLKEISARLDVSPQQDEISPLYSEIKAITLDIGEMEQERQALERLESQEKSLIVLINARIRKCLANQKLNKRNTRGLEMAPKIQEALQDYSSRLRTRKIKLLESNILEGIKKCFHKDRLITRISIEPETYKVTLYGNNDDIITKEELSQGELQMYATAIVWGLAKTSGRPLPFVIDTPLARLDKKHRENLIKNFYPTASHQTIIFSTNTEIIDSYFELLKPYLSHAKLLQYDASKDGSLVDDGYFNGGRIHVS